MEINRVHWKIGGAAGQGVKSSGLIFAKTCTHAGLHIFGYTEYPSLIKGGHNIYQVRVEENPVPTLIRPINMLVALDRETIWLHKNELAAHAVIIYDGDRIKVDEVEYGRPDVQFCSIPALDISQRLKVDDIMENQVFLGATFALLDLDFKYLKKVIKKEFAGKGKDIIDKDVHAAQSGYEYARAKFNTANFPHQLKPVENQANKMMLTGNDAIALGAIKAGCKFYAAYPMTPASSILHTMAEHADDYGIVVKHAEDEISVANMTVGAGHVGARAMCATSGGGFALMGETYSLAAMTETPLVMVEAQRGGPATGIPTWTEQADLKFVLNSGHGEFPRFVIAPGDPEEAYYLTADAFNIAERFQSPVVILTDKHLAESHWSYPFFDKEVKIDRGSWATNDEIANTQGRFKRYSFDAPGGVSKRVVPGQHKNGIYLANSDEHDEYGYSNEEIDNRNRMSRKRMQKMDTYAAQMPWPNVYGSKDADLTIVCWGSTKTMALQALKWLNDEGRKVNVMHISYISPFPTQAVKAILGQSKMTLNVEHNATAQMAEVIRAHTSIEMNHHLLKNDGRPIFPEEIAEKVRALIPARDENHEVMQ